MRYDKVRINDSCGYVLPIADVHIGDNCFCGGGRNLLKSNIEWVKNTPNARVFLLGDILNVATRTSKSSPFNQNLSLKDQIEEAVKLFLPIKSQIVGAISGNHEQRLIDICGYDPTISICHQLDIKYYSYSAVINFVVGKGQRRLSYVFYFHHTTGGGGSVGSKINRIDKLRELVTNCDCYVGGHNHQLAAVPVTTRVVDTKHDKIHILRQLLVDSGSYLSWDDNYPEKMQLKPTKLGSPRIRIDSGKRDIHCSI